MKERTTGFLPKPMVKSIRKGYEIKEAKMEEKFIPSGVYICTCGHWGFNILYGEIACLGCKKKYALKRFFRYDGKTLDHILERPRAFNKKIRKEEK